MKKLLCIALVICAGLYVLGRNHPSELQKAMASGELLRLHVVAASDDARDQQTKLAVRDAVLALCAPALKDSADSAAMGAAIESMLPAIAATAAQAALRCGYDGPVDATFGDTLFPERIYAGEVVPAGEYRALRVVLGDGSGANWWCVMYPPLCFVGEEAVAPGETVQVEFNSSIAKWLKQIRENVFEK